MAEILVEKRFCDACGVDVRPGSLFCYNCGDSVALKKVIENDNKNSNVIKAWFREDTATDGENHDKNGREEIAIEKSTANKAAIIVETSAEKPVEESVIQGQTKLKSAANLRRQSKNIQRKKIEILWEEPDASPNSWFIIVAVVLTLFTVGAIYLALLLR